MQIITHGKLPSERIYRCTCHHCGTVFECKQGETEYHPGDMRDPGYRNVRCPLPGCGRMVGVAESQVIR
jgi:hypothetical protein